MTALTTYTKEQLAAAGKSYRAYNGSKSPAARISELAAEISQAKIAAFAALPVGAKVVVVDADGEALGQYTKLPNVGPTEYVSDESGNHWHAAADTSLFSPTTNLATV